MNNINDNNKVDSIINMDLNLKNTPQNNLSKNVKAPFTQTLYAIGVIIILIGISLLYANYWQDMSPLLRVNSLFGAGIIFAGIGSYILRRGNLIGLVFHTISAFVLPFGGAIGYSEIKSGVILYWPFSVMFLLISVFFLLLCIYHKHELLTFFTILFGASSYIFAVLSVLKTLENDFYLHNERIGNSVVLLGFIFILIGFLIRNTFNEKMRVLLYFIGSFFIFYFGFFNMTLISDQYNSIVNIMNLLVIFMPNLYIIAYFIYLILGFLGSIFLKSTAILIPTAVASFFYISYLINRFINFDSKSWPIIIILLGCFIIGIGFLSYFINKKYIQKKEVVS